MPAGRTQQLQKKETPAEYRVPGQQGNRLRSHRPAACSTWWAGLVPENGNGSAQGLRDFREGLQAPVEQARPSNAQSRFLSQCYRWTEAAGSGALCVAAGCRTTRGADSILWRSAGGPWMTSSLDTAPMLAVVGQAAGLRECAERMIEGRFEVHLALPAVWTAVRDPLRGRMAACADTAGSVPPAARPRNAPADGARGCDVDEITESLKQIARCARWLWTNEPQTDKVTELLQWTLRICAASALTSRPRSPACRLLWPSGPPGKRETGGQPAGRRLVEQTAPLS